MGYSGKLAHPHLEGNQNLLQAHIPPWYPIPSSGNHAVQPIFQLFLGDIFGCACLFRLHSFLSSHGWLFRNYGNKINISHLTSVTTVRVKAFGGFVWGYYFLRNKEEIPWLSPPKIQRIVSKQHKQRHRFALLFRLKMHFTAHKCWVCFNTKTNTIAQCPFPFDAILKHRNDSWALYMTVILGLSHQKDYQLTEHLQAINILLL